MPINGLSYVKYANQWGMKKDSSGSAYIYATEKNQTFGFSFEGTRLEAMLKSGSDFGKFGIAIDGIQYSKKAFASGNSNILLLAENLSDGKHDVTLYTKDGTIPTGAELGISSFLISGGSEKSGITIPANTVVKTETVAPAEKLSNHSFKAGDDTSKYGETNVNDWISGDTAVSDASGNLTYNRPIFYKFDLSKYSDSDIDSVSLIAYSGLGDFINVYDVPGDDLSNTQDRISIDTAVKSSMLINWGDNGKEVAEKLDSAKYPGAPENCNVAVDITKYVKEELAADRKIVTFMVYNSWGGYGTFNNGQLFMKLASENTAPSVKLNVPMSIKSDEKIEVSAEGTDSDELVTAVFSVDGVESEKTVNKNGNVFSTVLDELTVGKHTLKAEILDCYGLIGTAETEIFVKGELPQKVKKTIDFSGALNYNFKDQKYQGQYGNHVIYNSGKADTEMEAPLFYKFDLSTLLDGDGDGNTDYDVKNAYFLFHDPGNGLDIWTMKFRDVPSNDISLKGADSDGDGETDTYVEPEYNKDKVILASTVGGYKEAYTQKSLTLDETYIKCLADLTSYVQEKVRSGNTSFSIRLSDDYWGGEKYINTGNEPVKLYVELIKKPDISEFEIVQKYSSENPTVKVKTELTGIEKTEIYVDGALQATVTESENGVYAADISGLSKGVHEFKAVVYAANGAVNEIAESAAVKALYENIKCSQTVQVDENKNIRENTAYKFGFSGAETQGQWYNFDISSLENEKNIKNIYFVIGANIYGGDNNNLPALALREATDTDLSKVESADALTEAGAADKLYSEHIYTKDYKGIDIYESPVWHAFNATEYINNKLAEKDYDLTLQLASRWSGAVDLYGELFMYVEYENDISLVTKTENGIKICINPALYTDASENPSVTAAVAQYSGNKLVNIDYKLIKTEAKVTEYELPYNDNYKVFIWNGNLEPLFEK